MTIPTQPPNADPAKDSDELFREKVRAQIMRNLEEIEKMAAERATMASQREKMAAETEKIVAEKETMTAEREKMASEREAMRAQITKMMAETVKMQTENQWYPAIVASTVTLAIVAVTKLFL